MTGRKSRAGRMHETRRHEENGMGDIISGELPHLLPLIVPFLHARSGTVLPSFGFPGCRIRGHHPLFYEVQFLLPATFCQCVMCTLQFCMALLKCFKMIRFHYRVLLHNQFFASMLNKKVEDAESASVSRLMKHENNAVLERDFESEAYILSQALKSGKLMHKNWTPVDLLYAREAWERMCICTGRLPSAVSRCSTTRNGKVF